MRRKHIYEIITSFSILLVLCISVGYAAISTNLKVSGTAISKSASWNVYFDNIEVDENSVTATTAPTINNDKNEITFDVNLKKLGDGYSFTFDIVNDGSLDAMVNLINITELTEAQKKYLDLEIAYTDGVKISKYDLLESGNTETVEVLAVYKDDASLSDLPKTEENIKITLDIEYVQDNDKAKSVDHLTKVYDLMKASVNTNTLNYAINSKTSGTNGIYSTTETDSGKTVYFYRGVVSNNLIFNNMCWKIIRTTESGGIRLLYNGLPVNGECIATGNDTLIDLVDYNSTANDNTYVGYMYGTAGSSTYDATHTNTYDSTIKGTKVDPWFASNFTKYKIKRRISDEVYCNDRSMTGDDNTILGDSVTRSGYAQICTGYAPLSRSSYWSSVPTPSLKCTNTNDRFTVSSSKGNGALTYPVGLITSDEVVFAGYNTYWSNTSNYKDSTNYLTIGVNYWTMSPIMNDGSDAYIAFVTSDGNLDHLYSNSAFGVSPVISLDKYTDIVSGTGTTVDPYVVF